MSTAPSTTGRRLTAPATVVAIGPVEEVIAAAATAAAIEVAAAIGLVGAIAAERIQSGRCRERIS